MSLPSSDRKSDQSWSNQSWQPAIQMQVLGTAEIQTLVTDDGVSESQRQAMLDGGIDLNVAPV